MKEHYLRDALVEVYPDHGVHMVFDKIVDGGCSRRRPDIRIECYTHTIIIECDENQHIGYSCERKRVMELMQDLGFRPIVIIRFNPDSYVDKDDKRVKGCFSTTTTAENAMNRKEWNRRIETLKIEIDKSLNVPEKEVTEVKLFYSEDI